MKKIGTLVTVIVFIVMVFTSIRFFTLFNVLRGSDMPSLWRPEKTERVQVLLVGRMNNSLVSCSLLSIPAAEGQPISVLRLPVQTLMDGDSTQSLAQIFSDDGIDAGIQSLNRLLKHQLPIQHYILYDVEGLLEIVEAIGGVEVNLPTGYRVRRHETDYVFSPGINLISRENLVPLVASKSDIDGGGFWAEKSLLVAVFNDLFSMKNLGNLVSNLKLVSDVHQTDMSPRELARFRDTLQAMDQENTNYLQLPGLWRTTQGEKFWSTNQPLVDLAMVQIVQGIPSYEKGKLVIDVFNGNGVSGYASKTATLLRSLDYKTGKVDNAQEVDKTHIYYHPEFKLAAMELALVLEVDAMFIQDKYVGSDNPVAIVLGRDLIGR